MGHKNNFTPTRSESGDSTGLKNLIFQSLTAPCSTSTGLQDLFSEGKVWVWQMNQITLLEYQLNTLPRDPISPVSLACCICQNRKMDRSKIDENILQLRETFDGIIGNGVKFCWKGIFDIPVFILSLSS